MNKIANFCLANEFFLCPQHGYEMFPLSLEQVERFRK